MKKACVSASLWVCGAPGRIWTHDPLVRSSIILAQPADSLD